MKIKIKNEDQFNIQREGGVYSIRCIPLNKLYIGSTTRTFRARFSNHINSFEKGTHNFEMQIDYNQYGPEKFEFEILEVHDRLTGDSLWREMELIEELHPEYNAAEPHKEHSTTNLGKKFSKNHIEKIRRASKLFRHKDREVIAQQNKDGGNAYRIEHKQTGEIRFVRTKKELKQFSKKNYKIEILKTQRKSVTLIVGDEDVTFKSFGEVDKFLNMWRGYTSTQMLKNVTKLKTYEIKPNENQI